MACHLPTKFFLLGVRRPPPRSPYPASVGSTGPFFYRPYSSEAPAPPLLAKLKGDLKAALKAKDKTRLAVLRGVVASTLNASKTTSPIKTDVQLVALLRKTARESQQAAEEFLTAGRQDLVEKEMAQIKVLEEYATDSGVKTVGSEELQVMVTAVMSELQAEGIAAKAQLGEAWKRLLGAGGPLAGKDFDKTELAKLVKELSASA